LLRHVRCVFGGRGTWSAGNVEEWIGRLVRTSCRINDYLKSHLATGFMLAVFKNFKGATARFVFG